MFASIKGRVRQTVQFVAAWVHPGYQDRQAQEYLTEAEYRLFLGMSRPQRQHHLRVLNLLLLDHHRDSALFKAALLHDVGKTRFRFGLPERILAVLVKAFLPEKFKVWSQAEPRGWKRPFVISACHPQWGAQMCSAIGVDPLAVELIARHQTLLEREPQILADRLVLLLQAADDMS